MNQTTSKRYKTRWILAVCLLLVLVISSFSLCVEDYFDFSTGVQIRKFKVLAVVIWSNTDKTLVPKFQQVIKSCPMSFDDKPEVVYKRRYIFSSSRTDMGYGDTVSSFVMYLQSINTASINCQDIKTISQAIDHGDGFLVEVDDQMMVSVKVSQ